MVTQSLCTTAQNSGLNCCLQTSAALKGGYDGATGRYGRPQRLRADMAFEALDIGQDMLDHRGAGSYLAGRSTANQVGHGSSACCQHVWVV